jgi:hypothetical protein
MSSGGLPPPLPPPPTLPVTGATVIVVTDAGKIGDFTRLRNLCLRGLRESLLLLRVRERDRV